MHIGQFRSLWAREYLLETGQRIPNVRTPCLLRRGICRGNEADEKFVGCVVGYRQVLRRSRDREVVLDRHFVWIGRTLGQQLFGSRLF
jgi:hypothetical protein